MAFDVALNPKRRNAVFLHRTDAVCGRRTRSVSHADAPRIHRAQVKQDLEDKGVAVDKVTEAVLRGQTLKTVAGSASPSSPPATEIAS